MVPRSTANPRPFGAWLSGPVKAPNLVPLGTLGGGNYRWVAVPKRVIVVSTRSSNELRENRADVFRQKNGRAVAIRAGEDRLPPGGLSAR